MDFIYYFKSTQMTKLLAVLVTVTFLAGCTFSPKTDEAVVETTMPVEAVVETTPTDPAQDPAYQQAMMEAQAAAEAAAMAAAADTSATITTDTTVAAEVAPTTDEAIAQ